MNLPLEREELSLIPVCCCCTHYHGYSYFGVALVCGLHPAGCDWKQKGCLDFKYED